VKTQSSRRYVGLLRGINVGGHKLIKMEALRRVIEDAGFANVRTFKASGNVIFDSAETDTIVLATKIERKLMKAFGHKITVVIIELDALASMAKRNFFKRFESEKDVMLCAVFFAADPPKLKLPLKSIPENLEVFAVRDATAFVVCRRKPSGWFGFPNNFVEKQFGVAATTRQWKTVHKLVAFARAD
jgi:uncharacterized protein (DUF1697 family)